VSAVFTILPACETATTGAGCGTQYVKLTAKKIVESCAVAVGRAICPPPTAGARRFSDATRLILLVFMQFMEEYACTTHIRMCHTSLLEAVKIAESGEYCIIAGDCNRTMRTASR
jgi:hypothetical protein